MSEKLKSSSVTIEETNTGSRTRSGLSDLAIMVASDYGDTIPLPEGTVLVILPPSLPPVVEATPQEGIRFRSPLSKGERVLVFLTPMLPSSRGRFRIARTEVPIHRERYRI